MIRRRAARPYDRYSDGVSPKVFFGFSAIMNPIANTPIFMGLTEELRPVQRRKVALKSVTIAFVITALFAVAWSVASWH